MVLIVFSMLVTLLFANNAMAVGGGVVKGTLKFHNRLSHFCPSITESRDCTGSKYNENAYDVKLPVSDMKIFVRVNGTLVGSGTTDANGNYQISWSYPYSGTPTSAQVEGFLEHKDGEFQVYKGDGSTHRVYGNFTASYDWVSNPSNANGVIQNLGTWSWGSSSVPNERLNMYNAAWRTWYYAFKYSGILLNYFDKLSVFAGVSTGTRYLSASHRAEIGTNDVSNLSYQAVFHEMGHGASRRSSNGQTFKSPILNGNYPLKTGDNGHNYNTAEWQSMAFEEGFADFLGSVSQYWYNAASPATCLAGFAGDYCDNTIDPWDGIDLEENPTCMLTNESRFQRNTTRFLWDYYDNSNETNDTKTEGYWHFLDANQDLTNSYGNNGKNEPWNSTLASMDDWDGRSLNDMRHMLYNKFGSGSSTLRALHCNPPGDY